MAEAATGQQVSVGGFTAYGNEYPLNHRIGWDGPLAGTQRFCGSWGLDV